MINLPITEQIRIAREIYPDLAEIGPGLCQATCPGIAGHTTTNGPRDFRIWFEEGKGPHDHCVHQSCAAARDAAMKALYAALRRHAPRQTAARPGSRRAPYAPAPAERPAPIESYDPELAAIVAANCPADNVDDAWLRARSPIPIPKDPAAWPRLLLDTLYRPGEKILIFTKYASQGQLLHTIGGDTERLEAYPPRPGCIAPPRPRSGFPAGAQNGVWFLAAPVTGEWQPNDNNRDAHGARLGRRHAACATRYPYLVLESDEAPPAVWLRILVQLQDPVAAICTSGGKSYHALVKVDCRTKEEFDLRRREYVTRLAALGADPAAITALRLTRLPGCLRYGTGDGAAHKPYLAPDGTPAPRMQRLLYLNPRARQGSPISANSLSTCKH